MLSILPDSQTIIKFNNIAEYSTELIIFDHRQTSYIQRPPLAGAKFPHRQKGNRRSRGGSFLRVRNALQTVQEIGGALRMGRCAEDCTLVFLQLCFGVQNWV
ncbi:hypothetical protein KX729_22255 [Rhizobium sp. XQZ8]|uniref:hypothetical protein n=1 Tax=Rhizobium populisoli TaxID=2859785 RepID=UPI001CA4FBC7|nr:hypothetical protein [Rhizobium populisoli]MBW6424189.1 hypothetical protein [Rhizobium populisoli]